MQMSAQSQNACLVSGRPHTVFCRVLHPLIVVVALVVAVPVAADDFINAKQAFDAEQFPKAIRLLRPLAKKGDPRAQHLLGYAYMFGKGVMTSETRAQYWLSKAVAQDYTPAFSRLGQVLLTIDETSTRGIELIKTAVQRGDLGAHLTLGMLYLVGLKGVPPDLEKSKRLFAIVAERKYQGGAFFLAYWHASGQGKTPDYVEVLRWSIIDSRIGNRFPAKFFRDDAMKRLTKNQIAEAKRRAAAWLKAHGETP